MPLRLRGGQKAVPHKVVIFSSAVQLLSQSPCKSLQAGPYEADIFL